MDQNRQEPFFWASAVLTILLIAVTVWLIARGHVVIGIVAVILLVIWVIEKYHMKLNPLWVNAPTIAFALLCTAVYFFRQ